MKKAEELAREYAKCPGDLYNGFLAGYTAALQTKTDKVQMLLDTLEFYARRSNWEFSAPLPAPHIGGMRMKIIDTDEDIGLLSQGLHDNVGGLHARNALKAYQTDEGV